MRSSTWLANQSIAGTNGCVGSTQPRSVRAAISKRHVGLHHACWIEQSNSSKAAFLPARSYCSLIFLLLSTFVFLTPMVSLAQRPTTLSAASVAILPISPVLTLEDNLYVSVHLV